MVTCKHTGYLLQHELPALTGGLNLQILVSGAWGGKWFSAKHTSHPRPCIAFCPLLGTLITFHLLPVNSLKFQVLYQISHCQKSSDLLYRPFLFLYLFLPIVIHLCRWRWKSPPPRDLPFNPIKVQCPPAVLPKHPAPCISLPFILKFCISSLWGCNNDGGTRSR